MTDESIESILSAMYEARQYRVAERKKLRDSILIADDYELFNKLVDEAHERAMQRLKEANDRKSPRSDTEDSEGTVGPERSGTSDDAGGHPENPS